MAISPIEASEAVVTYPAMYQFIQVHKASRVIEVFGDLRALGGANSRQYNTSLHEFPVHNFATIPLHLIQSRMVLEESPFSKAFTGFRNAARQMVATGTPSSEIIGGHDVFVDLFFRERQPTDAFTCSSWASELCRSFGEIDEFVRLGNAFLLTRLMRVSAMTPFCKYGNVGVDDFVFDFHVHFAAIAVEPRVLKVSLKRKSS